MSLKAIADGVPLADDEAFWTTTAVIVGAARRVCRRSRTTLRLEPVMWNALADIAKERGRSVHDILIEISRGDDEPNLSSAVRVYIVEFYRGKLR